MKILFVSGEMIGSALCKKLLDEGNDIKLYIHHEDWKRCLDGIIEKTDHWRAELDWVGKDGLIIFDDVVFGEEQDWLRHFGYTVVGSSMKGDLLELDRRHFQEIARQCDMEILPSYNFMTVQEAIHFVENNQSRWVVKQCAHESALNFISQTETGSDVIEILHDYKRLNLSPVHIQQYVGGVEVGVARYFNGTDWVGPVEINHEHKRLLDNDEGPLTPEMGTILWYTDADNPLFKNTLARLQPYLKQVNFRGDIDINCIVNQDKIWPLEATPRFGTPSTEIQIALHNSKWTDFLMAIASGNDYELDYKKGYGIGVSVTLPPFPHRPSNAQKINIVQNRIDVSFQEGLSEEDFSHIHFEEVAKDHLGYKWAGIRGWVLHVTAHDTNLNDVQKKVYERINKISMPGMFYRTDIGTRVAESDIQKLRSWGWV